MWKGIEWAIEYSLRQKNEAGVIASDSDELENRFESGNANLFTSSLLYDALNSAVYLCRELNKPQEYIEKYQKEAQELSDAIETYFGHTVEGYETYQYYKGNDKLRSWICIPLVMGIYDRVDETIKALFSDKLWTINGIKTQSDSATYWDRATLYALRGVFMAGRKEIAAEYLLKYSKERLLGEHVPYPVEAYPEGNGAHLSAESGLYGRVYTEGLFGIRPTGLGSFDLTIQMPKGWDKMALRRIKAFGSCFDIEASREGQQIRLKVTKEERVICNDLIGEQETRHIS